jgi:hypothetical protein
MAAFTRSLKALAKMHGAFFEYYPTGGQDRSLLADTVFTNSTMYSLVEFKDTTKKFISEKLKKQRVLAVCKAVFNKNAMQNLHDSCHFIAGDDPDTSEQVMFVYRHAICNRQIFSKDTEKNLPFLAAQANTASKLFLNEYAADVFSTEPRFALTVDEFTTYLEMLVEATTNGRKNLAVCLVASSMNDQNRCVSARFDNITELHKWAIDHIYPSPPDTVSKSKGDNGQDDLGL